MRNIFPRFLLVHPRAFCEIARCISQMSLAMAIIDRPSGSTLARRLPDAFLLLFTSPPLKRARTLKIKLDESAVVRVNNFCSLAGHREPETGHTGPLVVFPSWAGTGGRRNALALCQVEKRSPFRYFEMRGKKNPRWELRGMFVGVRGKKWAAAPYEERSPFVSLFDNTGRTGVADGDSSAALGNTISWRTYCQSEKSISVIRPLISRGFSQHASFCLMIVTRAVRSVADWLCFSNVYRVKWCSTMRRETGGGVQVAPFRIRDSEMSPATFSRHDERHDASFMEILGASNVARPSLLYLHLACDARVHTYTHGQSFAALSFIDIAPLCCCSWLQRSVHAFKFLVYFLAFCTLASTLAIRSLARIIPRHWYCKNIFPCRVGAKWHLEQSCGLSCQQVRDNSDARVRSKTFLCAYIVIEKLCSLLYVHVRLYKMKR